MFEIDCTELNDLCTNGCQYAGHDGDVMRRLYYAIDRAKNETVFTVIDPAA